ncbi:stage II sporulation protein E [Sporomusa malonica]|uniref:Stage II sporulation protein E n=1 Tax=Sporomusa malonica TaxID=112901 RepID=A0A1W2E4H1_9FIRM|nr:stage II sporulation protein E [Sporomusa malonica]SMD04669.1 stage II sporulation protein E [Sporomusa malonica]
MPKVSVVTLPEEMLQAPPARPAAESMIMDKPRFPWQEFSNWVKASVRALFHQQNLPINFLALLLGRVSLMGEVAPFGLALFAAIACVARQRAAAAGVWALAGVLSAGFYHAGIIYLISMLLYWRLSDKLTRYEKKAQAIPLFMFGSVFLSGVALMPWQDSSLYGAMLVVFGAMLCMVLAFIFQYAVPLFLNNEKIYQASAENLICGIIMLTTAVAGLGSLTVYDYSVRNIAGALIAMTLAYSGGSGLGASVGVVTGLVVGLSDGDAAPAIAMYALAGMLGGLFRGLGKPAVLLGYILGSAIAVLYFGRPGELLLSLVEASAAGAAFMLVPVAAMSRWRETCLEEADSTEIAQQTINSAVDKLNNIADIFRDLSGAFDSGSAKENAVHNEKIKERQLIQMLSAVGERVCGPCVRRSECWDRDFYQTYQAMLDMLALAEAGKLKAGTVPEPLKGVCANRQALVDLIIQVAESNKTHWYWQKKLTECRSVAVEQMKATGVIIGNLAQELNRGPQTDTEVAEMLSERATVLGCPLTGLRVTAERGKVTVEAQKTVCDGTRECVNTILPLTANLLQEKMTLHADCGSKVRHKNCTLKMELAERYYVETGMATAAKERGGVSGDTCAAQPVSRGRTALILSDGMGSGEAAASGSGYAVKFLQQLLTVGFDVNTAVKTVNSMLLIKMPGDMFATVDMAVVDTFTGETEFLKVGSAPSYVKRVREVSTINPATLPMGILENVEIEPVRRVLAPGDIVVMVSDGVIDAAKGADKETWVANFLRRMNSEQPQDIAERVLKQAVEFSGGAAGDDMAVLVAKVTERG